VFVEEGRDLLGRVHDGGGDHRLPLHVVLACYVVAAHPAASDALQEVERLLGVQLAVPVAKDGASVLVDELDDLRPDPVW